MPLNHKVAKEKASLIDHLVPVSIPIPTHKKICIELMDEIIFKVCGSHFLEPIQTERTVVKVMPKIQSIRTTSMVIQNPHVNPKPLPIKGLRSSRPLSYGLQLTAE